MTTLPSGLPLVVQRAGPVPLAVQISAQLEAAVTGGSLRAGDRLPSSRDLAGTLGVSRTVVTNAYARLFAEGWLEGRHGSGHLRGRCHPRAQPRRGGGRSRRCGTHAFHSSRHSRDRFPAPRTGSPGNCRVGESGGNDDPSGARRQAPAGIDDPGRARSSTCSPGSPGRKGSSRPPGGAPGGGRARTSRPAGPTRTACPSFAKRSPATCAGRAGSPSGRSTSWSPRGCQAGWHCSRTRC